MTHAFSIQDLPLKARLSIWLGDRLHLVLVVKQADGSDVSWAGYTAALVVPVGFPGTVVLNPAAVDTPGAGEVTLDIDTSGVVTDVRGAWRVEATQAGSQVTLFGGLLTCDHGNPTRLNMQSGCGLDIDSNCEEPIVVYVPAQGIPGPAGVGGFDSVSAEAIQIAEVLSVESTTGRVQKADASISGGKFHAIAVSDQTVVSSALAISIITNGRHAVRFASAPAEASNGVPVFLSMTAGLGTLTAPAYPTDTGNVVFPIGILEGADGASVTPDVLLNFDRYIRI